MTNQHSTDFKLSAIKSNKLKKEIQGEKRLKVNHKNLF